MPFEEGTGHEQAYYRVMKADEDLAEGRWMTGAMLMVGMGAPRDAEYGLRAFYEAAKAYDAFGLLAVSIAYEHGWGTTRNHTKALEYLRQSMAVWARGLESEKKTAEAGYYWDALKHTEAGFQYIPTTSAHECPTPGSAPASLFRALGLGRLDALAYLGIGLHSGFFTIRGYPAIAAFSLMEKAAKLKFWHCIATDFAAKTKSHAKAKAISVWTKAATGDNYCQAFYYSAYFEEDYAKSMEYFKKGSRLGCVLCSTQVFISSVECKTFGPMAAKSEAYRGLVRAARQGSPECMALVGRYLVSGTLVRRDRKAGLAWGLRSLLHESPPAYCFTADCFMAGWGCMPDGEKAVLWYQLAADGGFGPAWDRLGQCYQHGHGVPKDLAKARAIYETVTDEAGARLSLAYLYRYGYGGPMRQLDALKCLTEAAMQGNELAKIQLADGLDHVKDRLNLVDHLRATKGTV